MKRMLCAVLVCCLLLAAGCGSVPIPEELTKETLKVGVICLPSRNVKNGEGVFFGEQAIAACRGAGLELSQLIIKTDIPAANGAFAEKAMRDCIKRGCALIIGTAEGYAATAKKLAAEYPQVTFLQMGEADATLANYRSFRIRSYQGAYLCGVAAAVSSEKKVLGVVAAGTVTAEQYAQINAFALGARAVKTDMTVTVAHTGAEQSEKAEKDAVYTLARAGCDTLLQLVRGKTVCAQAEALEMQACSLYSLPEDGNETLLFGVLPMLQNLFSDRINSLLYDEPSAYDGAYLGYADKVLQCTEGAHVGELNLHDPLAAVEKQLQSGFDVFSGKLLTVSGMNCSMTDADLTDADGQKRITAAAPLDDAAIQSMAYYLSGIRELPLEEAP